jgi:hypothetical protein
MYALSEISYGGKSAGVCFDVSLRSNNIKQLFSLLSRRSTVYLNEIFPTKCMLYVKIIIYHQQSHISRA